MRPEGATTPALWSHRRLEAGSRVLTSVGMTPTMQDSTAERSTAATAHTAKLTSSAVDPSRTQRCPFGPALRARLHDPPVQPDHGINRLPAH